MDIKTATIIDIKATDTTRYAQATQVASSQIMFTDTNQGVIEVSTKKPWEESHRLCYVRRSITSEQKGLYGIHHRELDGADYYKNVLNDVMANVETDYIVCHDAKQIMQLLSNAGVPVDAFDFICMSSVIKRLYPKLGSYTIPTLIYEFCENTAIACMPHNWHGRHDIGFMREIFRQVSVLNGLRTMQDWYELSLEVAHG